MPYTQQLTIPGAAVPPSKAALTGKALPDAAVNFAMSGKATRTRETYNFHWRQFTAWCAEQEVQALPGPVVKWSRDQVNKDLAGRKPRKSTRKERA